MHACMRCTRAHTRASHTCARTSACIYASTNTRRLSRVISLPVCIHTHTRTQSALAHEHHAHARTHLGREDDDEARQHLVQNKDEHSCRLVRVVAAAATNASHSAVSSSAAGSLIAADADPSAPAASTGAPAAVLSRRRILRWYRRGSLPALETGQLVLETGQFTGLASLAAAAGMDGAFSAARPSSVVAG